MILMQVGLGEFGMSWYTDILLKMENVQKLILVDRDLGVLNAARNKDTRHRVVTFHDLETAFQEKPDILLNVTPPHAHRAVVEAALRRGIPVLTEKPIALDYADAQAILQLSAETGVPVMVAENYRYSVLARSVRSIIESGTIGKIGTIQIHFFRNHHMTNYHGDLLEPLLMDVAIHHLDLLRYFTSEEAEQVTGCTFNPPWSWYTGHASAHFQIQMTGGIAVVYSGSLCSHQNETDWNGVWRLEGTRGTLLLEKDNITLATAEEQTTIRVTDSADSRRFVLDEFLAALRENRPGETAIQDNIKTFEIAARLLQQNAR
jgi:predicted dehydrogenase